MNAYLTYRFIIIVWTALLALITERGGFEPPETGTQSQQLSSLLPTSSQPLSINGFTALKYWLDPVLDPRLRFCPHDRILDKH